ncbi:hypothetical protein E2C01_089332 [Portunus trituberculatus]|uniref:Uncharacterized protein n=1 Tax=Portunus trituberculatus TaxID=210409 RepID=A0A5B7JIS4_PORTR|nr:hypothetical protein [Portunus trituberculatus]
MFRVARWGLCAPPAVLQETLTPLSSVPAGGLGVHATARGSRKVEALWGRGTHFRGVAMQARSGRERLAGVSREGVRACQGQDLKIRACHALKHPPRPRRPRYCLQGLVYPSRRRQHRRDVVSMGCSSFQEAPFTLLPSFPDLRLLHLSTSPPLRPIATPSVTPQAACPVTPHTHTRQMADT